MAPYKRLTVFIVLINLVLITNTCMKALAAGLDSNRDSSGEQRIISPINGETYNPYPQIYDRRPELPSPFMNVEGLEYVVAFTKEKKYVILPVTVENRGKSPTQKHPYIKGEQLAVDDHDFPALAATGLHSERELEETRTITGRPVEQITKIGRPSGISSTGISTAGFLAPDENIVSVLRGDNHLVRKLGLTHPEMARPLYHVWNMLLLEYDSGRAFRYWEALEYFLYNGKEVMVRAEGSRGFQESIFDDEIRGAFQIWLRRNLNDQELKFIRDKYSRLTSGEIEKMIDALTRIHTGEMVPYYIMRYGFYEGHTSYRADPIAVAFIFGMSSLDEIEAAFDGELYEALTKHFR